MKFKLRARPDKTWPNYLFWGRMRTSTFGLIVAFFVTAWLFDTYQPPPVAPTPPATQVVPPGYVPDPEYTWVPRTSVREYPRTTEPRTTEPRTTTPETTVTSEPTTTTPSVPDTTTPTPTPTTTPPPTTTTPPNPFLPTPPTPQTTPPTLEPGPGPVPTPPAAEQ